MPAKISQGWIDNDSKGPFLSHKWNRKVKKPAHGVKMLLFLILNVFLFCPAHESFVLTAFSPTESFSAQTQSSKGPGRSQPNLVSQIWEGSRDALRDLLQDIKLVNVEQRLKHTYPNSRILTDANKLLGRRLSQDISKGKALHLLSTLGWS